MALKQANTLAPSNVSATGFALGDARHIGGHRVVASLTELYALKDWQLLNPEETDTALALGQQWYVKGNGAYRLADWSKRNTADGWVKMVDPNSLDTTLFQIVTALPTSGINKNRIYIVSSRTADPKGKNTYAEYIYTGDTAAAYTAEKWEKLGEYTPEIDTSNYDELVERVQTGEFNNVLSFAGIRNFLPLGNTILSQSAVGDYEVVYLASTKTFVAEQDGKFYSNWADAYKYAGTWTTNGMKPGYDKIYIYNGTPYVAGADGGLQQTTSDVVSSTSNGLMSASDKVILDALNGEVDIANLDLADRIDDFIKGGLPTRLKVVHKVTLDSAEKNITVGTLDIFTDDMRHQLTEIFVSNYTPKSSASKDWMKFLTDFDDINSGTHSDGKVFACHRFYNSSMAHAPSGLAVGAWSKWRGGTDDFTRDYIDFISSNMSYETMSDSEVDALFT